MLHASDPHQLVEGVFRAAHLAVDVAGGGLGRISCHPTIVLAFLTSRGRLSQTGLPKMSHVSEVDLDDARRRVERAHDGSIGRVWPEAAPVESNQLVDPTDVLGRLW